MRPFLHIHGPGRAATSLAVILERRGWRVVSLSGGSASGAAAARAALAKDLPWAAFPKNLPHDVVLLLGVPDDRLSPAAEEVAEHAPISPGCLAVHLSGGKGLDVLAPLRVRGARVGAMHPLRSFPSRSPGDADLSGALVAIETEDAEDQRLLERMAADAGGRGFRLRAEGRALYHLGAAVMSNSLVALADLAERTFRGAGVPPELALPGLLELARGTLANVERLGVREALTGPVARGDVGMLEAHLIALQEKLPADAALYLELVRAQATIASRRPDGEKAGAVLDWLSRPEP